MKTNSIRIFISLIFLTGILQMDILAINWEYLTSIMAIHIIGSIVISLILLIPFANTHSFSMLYIQKRKNIDGYILGVILFLMIASGIYLFLIGNRGGDIIGKFTFYIHLFGGFLLIISLYYHIKKTKQQSIEFYNSFVPSIIFSLVFILYPTAGISQDSDKLVSIQYADNVKRYHSEDWTNSAKCKSCHPDIFEQWADSNHRNLVSSNPYYMVQEALAAKDMGEDFRQWCMQCHNPSAVTTKQKATSHGMNGNFLANEFFDKGATILQNDFKKHGNFQLEEGVSCVACHRITKADEKGNGSYSLNLSQRKKYPLEDSDSGIGQWLGEKHLNSKPNVHKQSYSDDLYNDSKYCASCHNESIPNHRNISTSAVDKKIVSTYDEWEQSSFNNPEDPNKHKSCIDCHMTNMKNGDFSPLKGTSTVGGKVKKDIKVHYFSGSNHFLSGLKSKTHEDQTIQLLKTSAKLDMSFKNGKLEVGVKNVGAGHHLPTGVADFRELWLDVEIKDNDGKIIFTSGKLNKDGDLKKEARLFQKIFGDKDGKPVGLLFWRYEKLLSDTRIPAGERRVEIYSVNTTKINYPIKVTVKLNFRIYPKWITTAVQKGYPMLPNPPILELNKIVKEFKR